MQGLALVVFLDFEYEGKQPIAHPADGKILLRNVGALVEPVRAREQLSRRGEGASPTFDRFCAPFTPGKCFRSFLHCRL